MRKIYVYTVVEIIKNLLAEFIIQLLIIFPLLVVHKIITVAFKMHEVFLLLRGR